MTRASQRGGGVGGGARGGRGRIAAPAVPLPAAGRLRPTVPSRAGVSGAAAAGRASKKSHRAAAGLRRPRRGARPYAIIRMLS